MTHRAFSRITRTINANWRFTYVPSPELSDVAPAADNWLAVGLPHTWNTFETTGDCHLFIRDTSEDDNDFWWRGWGWYKKEFSLDPSYKGKKIFLEFDGVQKHCRIYLNGTFIKEHKGGFNSFSADLTEFVTFGETNTLTVAVSNLRRDPQRIPPMDAGNWDVYGGIYRDVRLVITDPLHIPYQGNFEHEGGLFVTTPGVEDGKPCVNIKTYIRNDHSEAKSYQILHRLVDPDKQVVSELSRTQEIAAGELRDVDMTSGVVENARLWSVAQPNCYRIETTLALGDDVVDACETTFGFRWFHWDYENRTFYLNGEPFNIVGTNRHQEYPWLGDAIPKWMHTMDLDDIKYKMNHNFMRACHYIQDPCLYDYCDQHGIVVCEEVPNIKYRDFNDEVQKQNVIEMIRRDRNHPSIVMWSMGNETNCAADGNWAREEDDTRIIHFRKCVGRGEDEPHNSDQIDMENLLRCTVHGWYTEDDIQQEGEQDYRHKNGQLTGTEEWQHQMARVDNGSIRHRIDWKNIMCWIYADHGADREYGNCPLKHINPKGWVDAYRFPKYMYYLWLANYAEEPMVFIHPHYWRQQYLGQQKPIVIDSNCDCVELLVNGRSLGRREFNHENFHTNTFEDIPVENGEVTAVGCKDGRTVSQTVIMAGEPAKLTLETSHKTVDADRTGIFLVTATIVDTNGNRVIGACNDLHWQVEGPATLVGPDVYINDHGKDGAMEGVMYFDTPIGNVVRSTSEPGTARITVSSPGLAEATVSVETVAPQMPEDGIHEFPADSALRKLIFSDEEKRASAQTRAGVRTIYKDASFGDKLSLPQYRSLIRAFVVAGNPDLDTKQVDFEDTLTQLAEAAKSNHGVLVADDYNFITTKLK